MLGIPLYLFYIIYLIFVAGYLIYTFFNIYHLLRFGLLSFTTISLVVFYIIFSFLILIVSWSYIEPIDWQKSIPLIPSGLL